MENPDQKSQLPKTVPGFELRYYTQVLYSRSYESIEISGGVLTEVNKKWETESSWSVKVSQINLQQLYQVFVDNKFDLIKSILRKEDFVHDGYDDCLSLKLNDGRHFRIETSSNHHIANEWVENYLAIYDALVVFVFDNKGPNHTSLPRRPTKAEREKYRREEKERELERKKWDLMTEEERKIAFAKKQEEQELAIAKRKEEEKLYYARLNEECRQETLREVREGRFLPFIKLEEALAAHRLEEKMAKEKRTVRQRVLVSLKEIYRKVKGKF